MSNFEIQGSVTCTWQIVIGFSICPQSKLREARKLRRLECGEGYIRVSEDSQCLAYMLQSQLTIPFTPYLPRPSFPCRLIRSITPVAKISCLHRFCTTTQSPTKLASPHHHKISSLSSPSQNQSTTIATRRSDLVSRHLSSTTPSTTSNTSYGK